MNIELMRSPMPTAMRGRPIDHRGFPVPWFVTEKDEHGHWDFVHIQGDRAAEAIAKEVCWVSGQKLGRYRSFCVGPMCVINRTAGDPPVTLAIALWSVKVCPFMSKPLAKRDRDITEAEYKEMNPNGITRNPGVTAIYTTRDYKIIAANQRQLFRFGDPEHVTWWREGRPATRKEVDASIDSGIPTLIDMAREQGDGAVRELEKLIAQAEPLLPAN